MHKDFIRGDACEWKWGRSRGKLGELSGCVASLTLMKEGQDLWAESP